METLYELHQQFITNLKPTFRRALINDISWEAKGLAILGARGVGKTTLILQYIKEQFKHSKKALYISMDHIVVQPYALYDIAKYHNNNGGTHLFIDEIHKYDNWSTHLKSIADSFPQLYCVVSGSSILQIYKAKADLSRRFITYHVQGLSFREYLGIAHNVHLPAITINNIITNHVAIAQNICSQIQAVETFKTYLQYGYYPFYLQGTKIYAQKIQNVLNAILEVDLPIITGLPVQNIHKIKKLISIIAQNVPYQPNITKLAETLDLNRSTLYLYIDYLQDAAIINRLYADGKSLQVINKPDKIFLHNTNISYSFGGLNTNVGCVRETFFLNQLMFKHNVTAAKQGDFVVNNNYIFEVGGKTKAFKQIANLPNSYVVADDILIGYGNKIPIWLFGFLY